MRLKLNNTCPEGNDNKEIINSNLLSKKEYKDGKEGFINIQDLKKGDYFKLKKDTSIVYVYDGYNKSTKKYSAYKFSDINAYTEKKKNTVVFVNFDF